MKKQVVIGMLLLGIVCSCNDKEAGTVVPGYDQSALVGKGESSQKLPDSTLSVAMIGNDTSRMFIKTVEMKFRVQDVFRASLKVEEICKKYKGFIVLSQFGSNQLYTEKKKISEDSSLEILHYVVNATIKMRVPVEKSDSLLNDVYPLIDYLDNKTISADEVGFQYLYNKKRIERRENFKKNIRKSQRTSNVSGENIVLYREDEEDNAVLENLELLDKVKFSTIVLEMYQREQIKTTVVPNDENIDEYKPGFFKQLLDSFVSGWYLLKDITLFVVSHWSLWLFIGLVVIVIAKYRKRRKQGH